MNLWNRFNSDQVDGAKHTIKILTFLITGGKLQKYVDRDGEYVETVWNYIIMV